MKKNAQQMLSGHAARLDEGVLQRARKMWAIRMTRELEQVK
jgi:hypothetical protein